MNARSPYDYIVAGAGAAGLSLVMRILKEPALADKKILLIDKVRKKGNDRTWCFWEKEAGFFEEIVFRQWEYLGFSGEKFDRILDIAPYRYKMIRGEKFYEYCMEKIRRSGRVEFLYNEILDISSDNGDPVIHLSDGPLNASGALVFNSVYRQPRPNGKDITLLQHFKGWVLEADEAVFAGDQATLMDFSVHQQKGTSFIYVLPFDEKTALVEYTLFTRSLLEQDEYDGELKKYISGKLAIDSYRIREQEFGVIPMTSSRFPFFSQGVYHIGAAGGQTKPSTGYTFQFIQKQTTRIVACLASGRSLLAIPEIPARYRFYDQTLLYILFHNKLSGKKIFTELFKKNDPARVLRFLDNESSLTDDLKIISSLPAWPFLKASVASR